MRLSRRIWATLALSALFGGVEIAWAQFLNEPPPRPLVLNGATPLNTIGTNVIATTNAPKPPLMVQLTVPDDGLATPAKPVRVVDYRPDPDHAPALLTLPAQVSVEVAGPASVALGEPLCYELVVRNTGGGPANRVVVEDPLPTGARLLRADPPAECRAGSLCWELGTLEAGAERSLKVDLQFIGIAQIPLAPRVAFTAVPVLQPRVARAPFMAVLLGPETAALGETVTFQIQLSNDGATPVRRIVLRDQLPPGLLYPRGYVIEADVGDLVPGQSRTVRLDAVAAQAGRFVNEIVATADGGVRVFSRCVLEVLPAAKGRENNVSAFAAGR